MTRIKKLLVLCSLLVIVMAAVTLSAGATELKTGIGIVDSSGLRLRAKPNTDAEILSTASYGDSVVIIRQVNDWYLVDYNLDIGYMSADHVIFKDRENVDLGYGKINTSSVNMRSTPSPDGNLVKQIPYGDTAYIIGFNCGWYKVQYNGATGYIRSDLMDLTEKPKANSASSSYVSLSNQIVSYAKNLLGVPYVWGGTTKSGFDCSGFTRYVYNSSGISLNRTAAQQLGNGYKVSELQPGDLVFFNNTYVTSAAASHVGIYIGNNQFIHAGGNAVQITSMSDGYYAPRYIGARRVL